MDKLTWKCHICKEERPDRYISVLSYSMRDFKEATINVRYCNDNPTCLEKALEWKLKGEFPQKGKEIKND